MKMLDTTQNARSQTGWLDAYVLTRKQRIFVLAYLEELNATDAARRAGYAHPNTQGPRLLVNVGISAAIEFGLQRLEDKLMIRAEDVRRYWWMIATADARDLVAVVKKCCRHCYGLNHEYQWRTEREYRDARNAAILKRFRKARQMDCTDFDQFEHPSLPNSAGGFGYRSCNAPNPDCPECEGLGVPSVQLADTRQLPPKAALLYDGVRQGSIGPIVLMQDRSVALHNLAKSLRMLRS